MRQTSSLCSPSISQNSLSFPSSLSLLYLPSLHAMVPALPLSKLCLVREDLALVLEKAVGGMEDSELFLPGASMVKSARWAHRMGSQNPPLSLEDFRLR